MYVYLIQALFLKKKWHSGRETQNSSTVVAANEGASEYDLTCKSYQDYKWYGPDYTFDINGRDVNVQQNYCLTEAGNINVTPENAVITKKKGSYNKNYGGRVILL